MKRYLIILLIINLLQSVYPQSASQNYIQTRTYTSPTTYLDKIDYYDGLGRPVETVQKQFSPNGKDLVTVLKYDNFGRQDITWLPSPNNKTDGSFNGSSTAASEYGDSYAYSQAIYEPSPLNRISEQYGPGNAWRTSNRRIKTEYLSNTSQSNPAQACGYYYLDNPYQIHRDGYYAAGTLYVTKVTDEDNNVSYEFKDKLGRVVLQRQVSNGQNHDTHYIYDDFGNLVFVLPPLASDHTASNGSYNLWSDSHLPHYAYFYFYDSRNRLETKRIPDSDVENFVYDRANRVVMRQTAAVSLGFGRGWVFYKYDALGRLILSGIYHGDDNTDYDSNMHAYRMKMRFADGNILSVETPSQTGSYKYTWNVFPTTDVEVTQANYYDNYAWNTNTELNYQAQSDYDSQYAASAKGLLTGSVRKLLDGSGEISSAYYYDVKGNLVQKRSTNHMGGYDNEYYAYNYNNLVIRKYTEHRISGQSTPSVTEKYVYNYDATLRLLSTTYSLNGSSPVTIAEYAYDKFGRIQQKKAGNNLETATFSYNVRNWQTAQTGTRFSESLYYNTSNPKSGGHAYFNGNIAAMTWKSSPNTSTVRGYDFEYDALGRLKHAVYGEGSNLSSSTGNYTESFTYDKHGNPLALSRYGLRDNNSYGLVDDLQMTQYIGNMLRKVEDNAGNQSSSDVMEFKDGYTGAGEEYSYGVTGSLVADYNKGICMVKYNYLVLPKSVQFRYGHRIETVYDAAGVKRRTRHRQSNRNLNYVEWSLSEPVESDFLQTTTTDYVANKIYVNGQLSKILTEEGYIAKSGSNYNHYYYLKDHLGNHRIVMDASGNVVQVNNYYPSGATMADYPRRTDQGIQPYKFGGKELDRSNGLDFYDFEARSFDPALMRFTMMDPLAEKYYGISPYVYCLNNPMRYIDPDGRDPGDLFRSVRAAAKDWGNYYNGASILRGKEFASTIYKVEKDGKVYYTYSEAAIGRGDHVKRSEAPNEEATQAIIHSHGEFLEGYNNNEFSNKDKWNSYNLKVDSYVTTPNGSLKKYDPTTTRTTVIDTNLPSDSKDPDRKNNIIPTDVPMEKKREQTRAEQEKKPELKVPETQLDNYRFVF
jgi:RHS repeat-associated protein